LDGRSHAAVGYVFGWLFLVIISVPYLVTNDLTAVPANGAPCAPRLPTKSTLWRLLNLLRDGVAK
jgi:hypothetical protein